MASRTIPEPTNTDFSTALTGIRTQATACGVNPNESATAQFINHQAEVIAQLNAEVRWLQQFIHPNPPKTVNLESIFER